MGLQGGGLGGAVLVEGGRCVNFHGIEARKEGRAQPVSC